MVYFVADDRHTVLWIRKSFARRHRHLVRPAGAGAGVLSGWPAGRLRVRGPRATVAARREETPPDP